MAEIQTKSPNMIGLYRQSLITSPTYKLQSTTCRDTTAGLPNTILKLLLRFSLEQKKAEFHLTWFSIASNYQQQT